SWLPRTGGQALQCLGGKKQPVLCRVSCRLALAASVPGALPHPVQRRLQWSQATRQALRLRRVVASKFVASGPGAMGHIHAPVQSYYHPSAKETEPAVWGAPAAACRRGACTGIASPPLHLSCVAAGPSDTVALRWECHAMPSGLPGADKIFLFIPVRFHANIPARLARAGAAVC